MEYTREELEVIKKYIAEKNDNFKKLQDKNNALCTELLLVDIKFKLKALESGC